MDFKEQLKSNEWKYKRQEIIERDKKTCVNCKCTNKTLNVHHYLYHKDLKLWEYDNEHLVTLCEDCHLEWHILNNEIKLSLSRPTGILNSISLLLSVTELLNQHEIDELTKVARILSNLKT